MAFFSKLFGHQDKNTQTNTIKNPLRIEKPAIGFMNLSGESRASLAETDKAKLSPLFHSSQISSTEVPSCHILFLYCSIDAVGRITGSQMRLRDIIKSAGAYIAVVATENKTENYTKAFEPQNDWYANIVLTIDRKGEKFSNFFQKLFQAMLQGKSMLMVWVELAPQIPGREHSDCPETIMLAEAGHITFGSRD